MKQSIEAGEKWKEVYKRISDRMQASSQRSWNFDTACLFSNIDAFIQRCVDLQDVCQAQLQFAPKHPIPIFGGLRGPQIKTKLTDIYVEIVLNGFLPAEYVLRRTLAFWLLSCVMLVMMCWM